MTLMQEIALRQSLMFGGITAGLVLGLLYALAFSYGRPTWVRTVFKALPLLAFILAVVANFGSNTVALALVTSLVADVALSRPEQRAQRIGLWLFAAVHGIYVLHFLSLGMFTQISLPIAAVIAVLALLTVRWLGQHAGSSRGYAYGYVALTTVLLWAALSISGSILPICGALALATASLLLAVRFYRLSAASKWRAPAEMFTWVFYILGQAAILAGTGFANPLFSI